MFKYRNSPVDDMGKYIHTINKDQLNKLYNEDRLSTREIAKILNVGDHMNVLRYMRKFGIKPRKNLVKTQYLKSKLKIDHLSETDKAYLAGIIDGEGCIHIGEKITSNVIRVLNTDENLIIWISEIFNSNIRIRYPKPDDIYNRKIYFFTQLLRHNDMLEFLKLILPYLHIKKELAIQSINYLEKRMAYLTNV